MVRPGSAAAFTGQLDTSGLSPLGSINIYPAGTTAAEIYAIVNSAPAQGIGESLSGGGTPAEVTFASFQEDTANLLLNYLTRIAAGGANAQALVKNGVNLDTGNWVSFKKENYALIDQLTKNGITVRIKFFYKGTWYLVTIPAGTEISTVSLCNADGYCGFMNLKTVFGAQIL